MSDHASSPSFAAEPTIAAAVIRSSLRATAIRRSRRASRSGTLNTQASYGAVHGGTVPFALRSTAVVPTAVSRASRLSLRRDGEHARDATRRIDTSAASAGGRPRAGDSLVVGRGRLG